MRIAERQTDRRLTALVDQRLPLTLVEANLPLVNEHSLKLRLSVKRVSRAAHEHTASMNRRFPLTLVKANLLFVNRHSFKLRLSAGG